MRGGQLIEGGIIKLPKGGVIHNRLYKLQLSISELVKKHGAFDILILEKIAVAFGGGGKGKGSGIITQGVVHLHWSCGVVLSAQPWPIVINVTPQSWRAWMRSVIPDESYIKSDENDAMAMTMCVYDQLIGRVPYGCTKEMLLTR